MTAVAALVISLFLEGLTMTPSPQPLTMESAERSGVTVITLQVGDDSEVGGQYLLEITDDHGNRSQNSGRFAPGQARTAATITVQSGARAHLFVTLDNGTSYEREWAGSAQSD